ncbi:MAG: hypothetical protein MZV64_34050 [Ignavibacteriales bacterium]|nr:hypothetical protein [Ignavibacteriales bacterium]
MTRSTRSGSFSRTSRQARTVATLDGRQAGAEHERPGEDLDEVDGFLGAGDEPADRGEGLAERAHDQVDVLLQAEVPAGAAAAAEDAERVGVVGP